LTSLLPQWQHAAKRRERRDAGWRAGVGGDVGEIADRDARADIRGHRWDDPRCDQGARDHGHDASEERMRDTAVPEQQRGAERQARNPSTRAGHIRRLSRRAR
jgi:hypothetical protein